MGHLEDEFTLTPLPNGRTKVVRLTEFRAAGWLWRVRQIGLMLALAQAHRYAARNWRRLSEARKIDTQAAPLLANRTTGEIL